VFFGFSDPEDEKNVVFGNIVNYLATDMMLLSRRLAFFASDFSSSLCFCPLYNDMPCDNT
jgi:hypothetical protein